MRARAHLLHRSRSALFPAGTVQLLASLLEFFVSDRAVMGLQRLDEVIEIVPFELSGDSGGDIGGQP
ncbi:hypothetical protein ADL05_03615 [Nocardiopsis sp. NRRL B-16309]|nr:hypothetical protein ADL05_03615 [Nocardiopsis sp. NRRL B-16309]